MPTAFEKAYKALGPIRCHYSPAKRKWMLDQKEATAEEIIAAAQRLRKRKERVDASTTKMDA